MRSTLPPKPRLPVPRDRLDNRAATALVVIWSHEEPHRLGEVFLVPDEDSARVRLLGRGEPRSLDRYERLQMFRQRPGLLEPTGPLQASTISREQLTLQSLPGGGLRVINVGRCPLLHNGVEVQQALVNPGDLLEFQEELLLLCVRRPGHMPSASDLRLHRFGEADEHGIVGESPVIWDLRTQLNFIGRRNAHVLILGSSGTGKELVARAVHAVSSRGHKPLVSRNAATFPETLIDAELFGNAKNYPNPGMAERPGLIGEADGSTLFLDEFGELPTELQAHLLRVLDQGDYQRLGDSAVRRADFRLVAATNRPERHLKHDILARLKLRLALPDLNARREDIPLLARHLLRRIASDDRAIAQRFFGGNPASEPAMTAALMTFLVQHPYTTHIRELEAILWRAIATSRENFLDLPDEPPLELTPDLIVERASEPAPSPAPAISQPPTAGFDSSLDARDLTLLALFRRHRFNMTECSKDPECPMERASADTLLRVLMFRALAYAEWELEQATRWMVGDADIALQRKIRERMMTTLENLQERLREGDASRLKEQLSKNYRGSYRWVEPVVAALQSGKLLLPAAQSLPASESGNG